MGEGKGRRSPQVDSNAEQWLGATYNPLSGTDAICHPSLFQSDGRSWCTHILAPENTHLKFRTTLPPRVP